MINILKRMISSFASWTVLMVLTVPLLVFLGWSIINTVSAISVASEKPLGWEYVVVAQRQGWLDDVVSGKAEWTEADLRVWTSQRYKRRAGCDNAHLGSIKEYAVRRGEDSDGVYHEGYTTIDGAVFELTIHGCEAVYPYQIAASKAKDQR